MWGDDLGGPSVGARVLRRGMQKGLVQRMAVTVEAEVREGRDLKMLHCWL